MADESRHGRCRCALLFRLLGQGIAYSASPAMMAAAFAALGLPHRYVLADVAPDEVPAAVAALRAADAGGANVTMPHKVAVATLVDEPSRTRPARRCRQRRRPRRAAGWSATTRTCRRSWTTLRRLLPGRRRPGRRAGRRRRRPGRAARAGARGRRAASACCAARTARWARLAEELAGADLLVNATPVGTGSDESPVPAARSCVRTWRCSTSSIGPAPRGSCARRARPERPRRLGRACCSARRAGRSSCGSAVRPRSRRCARPCDAELGGRSDA